MKSVIFTIFLVLLPLFYLLTRRSSKRLPPGSMGLLLVGHSLGLLKAMRSNNGEQWLQEKVRKYGPISKLNLFGKRTIFLHGPAANKFVYTCDGNTLANHQPASIRRIMGEKNLLKSGKKCIYSSDHKTNLYRNMQVMPLMKTLTFDIICSIIFGIERGGRRDLLVRLFQKVMEGMLSVPIDLPFTRFHSSLQASAKAKAIIMELIHEKREALEKYGAFSNQDLITCLLSICNEKNLPVISDEEIVDNTFIVMIAGHDTSSILLTFLVRLLAKDPSIYAKVAHGMPHCHQLLSLFWDDLANMKYTWRVATESLRMHPPVFCSFRQTLKDIEFGGYVIPKGWQVFWAACMTHMDENIYPDPSKFDPSRFELGSGTPFSFVAFGGGARICPGNEFARIETLTMIHYLVTGFTWKLSSEDDSFVKNAKIFQSMSQHDMYDVISS